ncbi:hypothetical protein D9M72_644780 [compost metagenome]
MQAVVQVGGRREAPGAVCSHQNLADLFAVVLDEDGVARRALAVEFRLAVVGDAPRSDRCLNVAGVVEGAI